MLGLPPAGYGGFVPGVCSSNLCAAPARSLRRRHFAPLQCASPPPYQSCAPPCKPGQRCARRRRRRRRRRRQLRQVVPANREVHWPLPHPATQRRRRRRHLPARGTTAASWRRRPSRRRKRRGAEDPVPAAAARVSRPRLPVVSRAGGRLASPRARAPVRDVDSGTKAAEMGSAWFGAPARCHRGRLNAVLAGRASRPHASISSATGFTARRCRLYCDRSAIFAEQFSVAPQQWRMAAGRQPPPLCQPRGRLAWKRDK